MRRQPVLRFQRAAAASDQRLFRPGGDVRPLGISLSFAREELSLAKVDEPANNSAAARERKIILLLCLLAAVHVFIFSAAFPFFNVVDEQVHFDLAVRYSQGDIPRSLTPPCAEALPFIAIYGTPEYLWPPSTQPGGKIAPPPWTLPMVVIAHNLVATDNL